MPNFPSHIRTILTQARHGQEAEYDKLSKLQKMVIDKDVQSIVEAALGCVGDDQLLTNRPNSYHETRLLGYNQAKAEIRTKLQKEEKS